MDRGQGTKGHVIVCVCVCDGGVFFFFFFFVGEVSGAMGEGGYGTVQDLTGVFPTPLTHPPTPHWVLAVGSLAGGGGVRANGIYI